jgi:hypothetical protein
LLLGVGVEIVETVEFAEVRKCLCACVRVRGAWWLGLLDWLLDRGRLLDSPRPPGPGPPERIAANCYMYYSTQVVSMSKKVGGVLIKKALHIVSDATDLMYYLFRIWGFILMVRDLLLEDY